MNKLMLMCLVFVIACSKSGDSGKFTETPTVQEASITAEINQEAPILLVMGNISYNKTLDGIVVIKQKYEDNLVPSGLVNNKLVFEEGSHEGLSIISQSGCTSIKKTTGSCTLKIRANASGLAEGTLLEGSILVHSDASLELDTRIYVQSTVGAAPIVAPQSLVSAIPTSLPYGSLSIDDRSKDLIVTFKAIDSIKDSDAHEVIIPSPFVLQTESADRCSNATIARGMMCTVKVRLDPKLVSTNGLVSGNITFAGLSVPVSATITGNPEVGQPEASQLAWIYNGSEISALDLGTLLSSNVPTKFNLILKNQSSTSEEVNVIVAGSGFTIINRCVEKTLLPQAQCSLEIRPESSVGTKSMTVLVDGQSSLSVPLDLVVIDQVVPVVSYQAIDTTAACSSLNLQSCDGTQSINKTYSCEKYIDGVKDNSYISNQSDCSLPDMTALSCLSPSGNSLVSISGGNLSYNCAAGVDTASITPTLLCEEGYLPNQMDLICEEEIVVPALPLRLGSGGYTQEVFTMIKQSNGKILVGGAFNSYNGEPANKMVRINTDYSIDKSFSLEGTGFNSSVYAIEVQDDGKIVVGGLFTSYNGTSVNRIARLNSNGTLDTSFNGGGSGVSTGGVYSLVKQSDGKMLVGGDFTAYNGYTVNRIIRLNSDGSLDSSLSLEGVGFNSAGATVYSMLKLDDGKMLVGGRFTTYGPNSVNNVIRLNEDFTLDLSFALAGTGVNNDVYGIAKQDDGKLIVTGLFSTYNSDLSRYIVRLNTNLTRDTSFVPVGTGFSGRIYSTIIENDGKILLGGTFITYNNITAKYSIILNSDASIDESYNVGNGSVNNTVFSTTNLADGKILLGGLFTRYKDESAKYLLRLNSDLSLDTSFALDGTGFNNAVQVVVPLDDGKYLVGGMFTSYNGVVVNRMVKLNADLTRDTSFALEGTGFNNNVQAIFPLPDGKILVGGAFVTYNGFSSRFIRLNADGTRDTSFDVGTGFNQAVYSITAQNDGKLIVAGNFTAYKTDTVNRIVRLNSDYTLDSTFNPGTGFNAAVYSIDTLTDGKMMVVGAFVNYNGSAVNRMVRLNSDYTIDTSFSLDGTGFDSTLFTSLQLYDGTLLVGGAYTKYNELSFQFLINIEGNGSLNPVIP